MYVQNHIPNTAFLLADLAAIIREHQEQVDRYLQPSLPYTFWERLGIRHVTSNIPHSKTASQDHWPITADKVPNRWKDLKNDTCIEKLRTYISNCSIIEFADYANVDDAVGFWDGLFEDVIKPFHKRDFEFIFHLGDTARRPVFEVDEILDIIGDYSSHGRVSLVLDDEEADRLWDKLQGGSYDTTGSPDAKEKYLCLFNTMRIDVLLILYNNRVLLFSRDGQFDFSGKPMNNIHVLPKTRDYFNAGFQLGLLLHLDIPHAIVLGQAVSGNTSMSTSRELLAYIGEWMSAYL